MRKECKAIISCDRDGCTTAAPEIDADGKVIFIGFAANLHICEGCVREAMAAIKRRRPA